jgi:hypothetical protein
VVPFVPTEDIIKWSAELIQNKFKNLLTDSKAIKEFKGSNYVPG